MVHRQGLERGYLQSERRRPMTLAHILRAVLLVAMLLVVAVLAVPASGQETVLLHP